MSKQLPQPLNVNEELLYGINVRIEVLIDQVSSLLQYIAEKNNVAVESGSVQTAVAPTEVEKPKARATKRGG